MRDRLYAAEDERRHADAGAILDNAERLLYDPEYADVDEEGQLALGVVGEQRALPGLARPRPVELEGGAS
jgi:hypothetical protein